MITKSFFNENISLKIKKILVYSLRILLDFDNCKILKYLNFIIYLILSWINFESNHKFSSNIDIK